jgi:vacuolar protein sorting-associated protein 13D
VTGSLSHGLSKATLDERYDERRLMLRRRGLTGANRSREHLIAGVKGLGFGVLGGLTSLVTETYEGVANDGLAGLFTGFGWGLVGTVSKPAIGVLDLATGAASYVKESSRGSRRQLPHRLRPPRVVVGPGGSMHAFSERDAFGQERMFALNGHDRDEIFVGHEVLRATDEDEMRALVTSERVVVLSLAEGSSPKQLLVVHLSQLVSARHVASADEDRGLSEKHFVEMTVLEPAPGSPSQQQPSRRPQVGKVLNTLFFGLKILRIPKGA